jgi:putative SOS response-associated peptidase YedK
MCGRYKHKSDKQAIADAFHLTGNMADLILPPDDDIHPTTMQPIIRQNKDSGERDLVMARWDFVPAWHKFSEKFPTHHLQRARRGY